MRVNDFVDFITMREAHRKMKEGQLKPGTVHDPIISLYRFCNVRREDDRVTKWIADNWRDARQNEPELWFAMIVARLFNLPETLEAIGYPVPFNPKQMRALLKQRRGLGFKVFNPAYIVSTNGRSMDKIDYILDLVLLPIWRKRVNITASMRSATLEQAHELLMLQDGLGSFMAAQVVADLKYIPSFRSAADWYSFAASGPGSRRGLKRVLGMPIDAAIREEVWREKLAELHAAAVKVLPDDLKTLHAQDIQNCLCEFDKYERARLGEGRPKQLYPSWRVK